MPGARVELYRDRFATDLAAIDRDVKGMMPMPAAFVIGREQRICVRVSR